jgi:hypothetical protein
MDFLEDHKKSSVEYTRDEILSPQVKIVMKTHISYKENKYDGMLRPLYIGKRGELGQFHKLCIHAIQHSTENDINKI